MVAGLILFGEEIANGDKRYWSNNAQRGSIQKKTLMVMQYKPTYAIVKGQTLQKARIFEVSTRICSGESDNVELTS